MNTGELKKLIIDSLNVDSDPVKVSRQLEGEGVSYSFRKDFKDRVFEKIVRPSTTIIREIEFVKYLNIAFYRIALTGVAAIILLLISIFLTEGSLSFNSFIGLTDNYDESIVCLLTGN